MTSRGPEVNPTMRFITQGRWAIIVIGAVLAGINAPVFVYRSVADAMTPYGYESRSYWAVAAIVNFGIGVFCIRWVFRKAKLDLQKCRIAHRMCPKCSYDLTGNTSGTCPECGTPVPTRAKTPETESPRPA
jgi:hypothetical protein